MKLKRFLSMLMAGVLCVGMLAGCGSSKDTTPVVMTVDGEDVQSSELAAYIVYNMMYYENYFGMDVSQLAEETIFDSIKEGCKSQVIQYRAIEKLAEQEGVTLSKESKEKLEENKNTNRESMGSKTGGFTRWLKYTVKGDEDPFVTYLNSYGYTEELYDRNCETMQLEQDIINKYYDDGVITEKFNSTYLHAKSILIADTDDEGNVLTGDALEAAKKQAQDILDQAKANPDDFDTLWEENNADTAQSDDGYYFTEGDMVDEYYNAINDMEIDSINDELVYHEGYGWFIIKKMELKEEALTEPSSYLNNTGDGDESTIKSAIGETIISDKLDEIIEALEVETTDEYDNITAYNVNTYLPFASDALVSGSGSAEGSAA
ncbi:peptidylprolyl isomerase [Butyricicoccus sp.]|uniref:peptidylprolyl isomerase n=1 Tax=Butyricicoccus sp. TaxID=2049021 RepID=UPI003F17F7F1